MGNVTDRRKIGNEFHGVETWNFLDSIDKTLKRGDRVEIIPIKDGKIKVMRVKMENVELNTQT